MTTIGDVTERISTWNPGKAREPLTFEYIDLSAVDNDLKAITAPTQALSTEAPSRARQIVASGDVLVSTVRPNLNAVAVVPPALDGATASTGFTVLRPSDKVFGRYLFHWVRSEGFIADMVRKATGASYPAISDRIVKESLLPLPAFDEQRRIAAILDRADVLRAKRRQACAHLDDLVRSGFLDMFGNPAANPRGWPVARLGDLVSNQDARRVPLKAADRTAMDGPFPYYGASGVIDHVNEYLFTGQRLLVSEDGANLLSRSSPIAFIADGRFWVNNHAHVLAYNGRAELFFLRHALEALDLAPFVTGSAQPKLNRANMDRIPIPVPPIELQRRFVVFVQAVHRLNDVAAEQAVATDEVTAALQMRAFSGRL